jgi:hypothetical protein
MTKKWKKLHLKKKFFGSKTTIYLSLGIKNVQVTEEAFSSQKRPSNTSKHELLKKFSTFVGHNTDPDPLTRLNTDPIRILIRNPAFY